MAQRKHRPRKTKIRPTTTTTTAIPEEEENKHNIPTTDYLTEDNQENRPHIPIDLLTEIFSLLPVSCLLTFTSVCKSWLELISSPLFIQINLNRLKETTRSTDYVSRILITLDSAIMDYDAVDGPRKKQIPYPPGFYYPKILGSCDGLICLFDEKNNKFSLFNPSARNSVWLLVDGFDCGKIAFSWFGHHPYTMEYVLVIGTLHWIGVYKLNSSSSCSILHKQEIRNYECLEEIGTLLQTTLYWPAKYHVIVSYHFKTCEILEIAPPRDCPFTLGVVDECLFVVCKYEKVFELWMMKDTWMKCANIEGFRSCRLLVPLGFSFDGEMVLDADSAMLIKYRFGDKRGTILKKHKFENSKAIAYTDSLVRPERAGD